MHPVFAARKPHEAWFCVSYNRGAKGKHFVSWQNTLKTARTTTSQFSSRGFQPQDKMIIVFQQRRAFMSCLLLAAF